MYLQKLLTALTILIFINSVSCLESMELSCTTDKDCDSFETKFIKSVCSEDRKCICRERRGTRLPLNCKPHTPRINNFVGSECPCDLPNTVCKSNICVCVDGFTMNADKLRCITEVIQLGKTCDINSQCEKFDKNSACLANVCTCTTGFVQLDNSCRSQIENQCEKHDDCGLNAECKKDKCVCVKNFIASSDKKECLPLAFYGDNCTESVQCEKAEGMGSFCNEEKKCSCKENYFNVTDNGKILCIKKIRYGDNCTDHNDCVAYLDKEVRMHCSNGKCACRHDYELYDAYTHSCVKQNFSSSSSNMMTSYAIIIILAQFVWALTYIAVLY